MSTTIHISAIPQPESVCVTCGLKYGRRSPDANTNATWHAGVCGVCHQPRAVTEPRDFGYLTLEWQDHAPTDRSTDAH